VLEAGWEKEVAAELRRRGSAGGALLAGVLEELAGGGEMESFKARVIGVQAASEIVQVCLGLGGGVVLN
jgi:hypothetical protein